MKHLLLLASIGLLLQVGAAEPPQGPVWPADFPDPTFWKVPDGTWRAASTTLQILKSSDFFHWEKTGRALFTPEERARIHRDWKHIWAPDAFRLGTNYLMYVSLVNAATNSAIAVYSSTNPEGPFEHGRIVTDGRVTGIRTRSTPRSYLFASRGWYGNHTYAVVVGRAKTLAGPFLDRQGRPMPRASVRP